MQISAHRKSCGLGHLSKMFFSFTGRLGRLAFLLRGMALGITPGLLMVFGLALVLHGALWWLGFLIGLIALAGLIMSGASLVVRRLHDLNLSGRHAIWAVPLQYAVLLPAALASQGVDIWGIDLTSNFFAAVTGAWLLFWPGAKTKNRFG
jgi:uncharacterized membrane protein YhaH (DUF805 family)